MSVGLSSSVAGQADRHYMTPGNEQWLRNGRLAADLIPKFMQLGYDDAT